MPTSQKRNDSMQQLTSVDQLRVQDRNFSAEWYDNTGGQTYTLGTAAFTVNLTTEKLNTAPTLYTLASSIITISEAGIYLFNYQVTSQHDGGSSIVVNHTWLEEDPDTGVFATIPSAVVYFPVAGISSAPGSGSVSTLLRVGIDYRYRIRLEETHGSSPLITVANGSSLRIIRLWQNG